MDMQKRWIILFVALLSISFLGLFYSGHEGMFTDIDSNLNFADIAWMITATIFVLMMTPGLSFMEEWYGLRMSYLRCCRVLLLWE